MSDALPVRLPSADPSFVVVGDSSLPEADLRVLRAAVREGRQRAREVAAVVRLEGRRTAPVAIAWVVVLLITAVGIGLEQPAISLLGVLGVILLGMASVAREPLRAFLDELNPPAQRALARNRGHVLVLDPARQPEAVHVAELVRWLGRTRAVREGRVGGPDLPDRLQDEGFRLASAAVRLEPFGLHSTVPSVDRAWAAWSRRRDALVRLADAVEQVDERLRQLEVAELAERRADELADLVAELEGDPDAVSSGELDARAAASALDEAVARARVAAAGVSGGELPEPPGGQADSLG